MIDRSRTAALAALVVLSALAVAAPATAATAATDDAELSLAPAAGQVATGESVTYGVVADVDDGVGSYGLDVAVEDPGTATITNVSSEIGGTARTRVDGGHARIAAVGGDAVDDGSGVLVATVTVRAEATGSTGLSLEPASLADEGGDRYRVTGADGATLDVTETAPTIGASDAPAGDPDGDGRVTREDARALFRSALAD
jgi:uncharacterized cupredoxin-like copper-binding protein